MNQALILERVLFPEFNRMLVNWADFRRVLKEMMKDSGQGQVLEIARLTSAIPKDDGEIDEEMAEPEEAWKKLGERYGDRKLTIIEEMSDLTEIKLTAGLAHKKLKALVQGVRLEKVRFRAV